MKVVNPHPQSESDLFAKFLENVRPIDRNEFAAYGCTVALEAGDTLAVQGEEQDTLFVILDGLLTATRKIEHANEPINLGKVEPGETVGEMSILDQHTASATVTADDAVRAWQIQRKQFEQFLIACPTGAPPVLRALAIHITRRLRHTTRELVKKTDRLAALEVPVRVDIDV